MTRNQASDLLTKGNRGIAESNWLIGLVGVADRTNERNRLTSAWNGIHAICVRLA